MIQPPLVPEDEPSDADSTLGDDAASSTASITSSIMQYRTENGRTYHGYKEDINYVLPNDAPEQDRLDLQHHLFMVTLNGRLYLSPLEKDKTVRCLDAGTGTGVWAMDFADEHPNTEVTGIDLSVIQPEFVPPNLSFQVDDLEDEWNYRNKFDFVFGRMLVGSIGDWPKFIKQSHDNLNPGGWLELHDISFPPRCDDDTMKPEHHIMQWSDLMYKSTSTIGRHCDSATRYKEQMIEAGFINVTEVIYRWPMNRWPADPHYKDIGLWCYENIAGGLSGISMALFTRVLGWSSEEVEVFCAKAREDMKDRKVHAWWPIFVVYGQKKPD